MSDTTKRHPEDEEIKRRVLENLDALDRPGKLEVLHFSEALSSRARLPAERDTRAALLKYAGTISKEDLDLISEAIEEGCEKVDEEGW
jgi:hypothetical protein